VPPTRLDRAVVLDTAEALVDRDGWRQLTITALATKLGVRGPSLYNHVDGIDALLGELQVRALRDLGGQLQRAAMGKAGRDGMRALAAVLRDFAARWPGRYDLAMREPFDHGAVLRASAAASEALSAVIASFGVAEASLELQLSCLAPLHGVLALDRSGLMTSAVDTSAVYDRAVDLVVLMLEHEGGA
jgi:AcrR family transcriptional regulator